MSGSAVTGASPAPPGFFGKLPGQGDFVTRRLSQEFLRAWDPWLQAALTESRASLGEDWLEAYLTSPIWRFVLNGGIAGQAPWAGLLMPSVDRIGRYFPLTVACELPPGCNPFSVMGSVADWFGQTQSLMLAALEGVLDVQEMDAQLLATCALPPQMLYPSVVPAGTDNQGWRLSLERPAQIGQVVPALLHHALTEVFFAYSLWWSEGSERITPSLLLSQGLPTGDAFESLYTGDWSSGSWWDLGELAG
jgi:type VI secretion system protein ImpM